MCAITSFMLTASKSIQDVSFDSRREMFQFLKDYFERKDSLNEPISLEDYGRIASWIRKAGLSAITEETSKHITEIEGNVKEDLHPSLFETRSFFETLDPQLETTIYPLFYSSWTPIVSKHTSINTTIRSSDTAPQKAKRLLSALLDVQPTTIVHHRPIYPFGHQPKYHSHISRNLLTRQKYPQDIPIESLDIQIDQDHPSTTKKRQRISETTQALITKPHVEPTILIEKNISPISHKENIPIDIQETRQITIPKPKKLGKTFSAAEITISEQDIAVSQSKSTFIDTKQSDTEWLDRILKYKEKHPKKEEPKQSIVPIEQQATLTKQDPLPLPKEEKPFSFEYKPIEPQQSITTTINTIAPIQEKPQFSFQFGGSSDANTAPFVFGSSVQQPSATFTFEPHTFTEQSPISIPEQGSDRKFTVPTSRRRKK